MELSDFLQAMEHTEVLQLLSPQVGLPREHVLQEVKEAHSEGSVSFDQMNCVKNC